ncbi:MAG: hypothetical protein LH480_05600 [Rubrivivax sp.]|nr:hypothetical protein [Rubrivivax sp.]
MRMNLRHLFSFLLLSATLALAACAGGPSVSMTAADRTAIKQVAVLGDIKLPDAFSYQERGAGAGAMFGLIGALAEASARSSAPPSEAAQMQALIKSNDIVVGNILRAEFIRAANARDGIRFADSAAAADADLTLTVNMFGFHRAHVLGAQLYPIYNVTASMKRRDGVVLWQKTDYLMPTSLIEETGFSFSEYQQDPAKLRTALTRTAASLMSLLADKLPS